MEKLCPPNVIMFLREWLPPIQTSWNTCLGGGIWRFHHIRLSQLRGLRWRQAKWENRRIFCFLFGVTIWNSNLIFPICSTAAGPRYNIPTVVNSSSYYRLKFHLFTFFFPWDNHTLTGYKLHFLWSLSWTNYKLQLPCQTPLLFPVSFLLQHISSLQNYIFYVFIWIIFCLPH